MVYTSSTHRHTVSGPRDVLPRSPGRGPCRIKNEGGAVAYVQVGSPSTPDTGEPLHPGQWTVVHCEEPVSICCADGAITEISVTPGYGAFGGDRWDELIALATNQSQVMESIRDLLKNINDQLTLMRE